jgi:hypothetical protein
MRAVLTMAGAAANCVTDMCMAFLRAAQSSPGSTRKYVPAFATSWMMSPQFRDHLQTVKSATTSVCAIYQRSIMAAPIYVPSVERQGEIVRWIGRAFTWIERLASEATSARKLFDRLDPAVLAKAFRGELVPQDPNDEPASALLERIRAERAVASAKRRCAHGRSKKLANRACGSPALRGSPRDVSYMRRGRRRAGASADVRPAGGLRPLRARPATLFAAAHESGVDLGRCPT